MNRKDSINVTKGLGQSDKKVRFLMSKKYT